jgi:DUF1365 family protein
VTPSLYECVVRHARTTPLRHSFAYRTYQWLVDLDELPRNRWLAGFHARDHVGDPARSIRRNLDDFLAGHGIDLAGGRILMLTNARSLGYVFNPLTVYWCRHADGTLRAVVAEVHNTYGGRHCYLLTTETEDTAKELYVSPFFGVDGTYHLRLPEPDESLALTVALDKRFVATLRGQRRRPGLTAMLRHPLVTFAVTARIRAQGIRLYLKGLPVMPR